MGNVSKGKLEAVNVVLPPHTLIERYHFFVSPLFAKILALSRLLRTLRKTRDLLLPRLLSGQLDPS
jgi:type I restriction enzyme S subunit